MLNGNSLPFRFMTCTFAYTLTCLTTQERADKVFCSLIVLTLQIDCRLS